MEPNGYFCSMCAFLLAYGGLYHYDDEVNEAIV